MATLPLAGRHLSPSRAQHGTHLTLLGLVWRTLVVAVAYVVLQIVVASGLTAFGFDTGAQDQTDATTALITMFVGGLLIAPAVGPFALKLPLSLGRRILLLFVALYSFAYLIGAPELILYTTYSASFQWFILLVQATVWLGVAVLLALLFQPERTDVRFGSALRAYLAARPVGQWLWRLALAALLFFPIYFGFGLVFSPLTVPFYQNPASNLGLTIPPIQVMFPVAVLRGLWYALTVMLLLPVLNLSRGRTAFWVGLVLAVIGAALPQITNTAWPWELRVGHGVEMVLDSFAQGLLYAWLLWVPHPAPPDRAEA